MSERRPYDENQLQRLTDHMMSEGTGAVHHPSPGSAPPTPPTTPSAEHAVPADLTATAVAEPTPEATGNPYPGTVSELRTSVRGLGKIFSSEGRTRRAEQRRHRQRVLRHSAHRITNPRQTDDPNEKTGWVGTHKLEVDAPGTTPPAGDGGGPEDFSKLGANLFPKPPSGPTQTNMLRPATRSEIAADKRLDRKMRKARRSRNLEQWIRNSYPGQLDNDPGYRTSSAEKRHMRYAAKRAGKLGRQADASEAKLHMTANTNNFLHYYLEAKKLDLQMLGDRVHYQEFRDSAAALGSEILDRHYEALDLTKEQAARVKAAAVAVGQAALRTTVRAKESVKGSAKALGQEIIESHYDSLDMTKEQAARAKAAALATGQMAVM